VGGIHGDVGFAREYGDDHLYGELWGFSTPESRQTGHFLTAVNMGYQSTWWNENLWTGLIAGHEVYSDKGLGLLSQVGVALRDNSELSSRFEAAVVADTWGFAKERDVLLQLIYNPALHGAQADRQGNSMEDLRLSVRGWRLGQLVANGSLTTNKDVANWVAWNIAGD
jgi:hypothetical protein